MTKNVIDKSVSVKSVRSVIIVRVMIGHVWNGITLLMTA